MRSTQTKYRYKVLYADGKEIYRRLYNTPTEIEEADILISTLRYNSRFTEELCDAKFKERIEYR